MTQPIRDQQPLNPSSPASDLASPDLERRTRDIISELALSKPSKQDVLQFISEVDSAQIELPKDDDFERKNQDNSLNLDLSQSVDEITRSSVLGDTLY